MIHVQLLLTRVLQNYEVNCFAFRTDEKLLISTIYTYKMHSTVKY